MMRYFTMDGKTHSLSEWCRIYDINLITVDSRIRRGWSPEDAIKTPIGAKNAKAKAVTINGETKSVSAWCREFGANPKTANRRIERGWSPEEAIRTPVWEPKETKALTMDGRSQLISDWCKDYGIDRTTVDSRIKRGWSPEDAIKTPVGARDAKIRAITINGETKSVSAWCRHFGVNPKTAQKRIERGWDLRDAVKTPAGQRDSRIKPITINGETKSMSAWCRQLGLSPKTVWKRVNRGRTPEAALFDPKFSRLKRE